MPPLTTPKSAGQGLTNEELVWGVPFKGGKNSTSEKG